MPAMKTCIALARIGAVLSAVALLGVFVYVRAGGRIGRGGEVVSQSAKAELESHRIAERHYLPRFFTVFGADVYPKILQFRDLLRSSGESR
jgi:hypothetical protein